MRARADRPVLAAAAVAIGLLLGLTLTGCGGGGSSAVPSPTTLADRFLDRYVTSSGAVVRRDQGGDVVSEGQAYAMVLADMAGRPQTVRTVWSWTQTHLQRSADGLLSWHAKADGTVLDPQPAADADVLAAWALLDYRGPGAASLASAGKQIASAVLARETVQVGGQLVLAAGPWATTGTAPTVDPSYWMPSVFRALGTATHDQRWTAMADTSVQLLSTLTHSGQQLPPDWAQVQGSALVPVGAPGTSGSAQYGLDAERSPVWLAIDCTQKAHQLAAGWWSHIRDQPQAMTRSLDGSVTNAAAAPLGDVAAAAAAEAAGKSSSSKDALDAGIRQAEDHPTYYGDAWAALGAEMLAGRAPACSS